MGSLIYDYFYPIESLKASVNFLDKASYQAQVLVPLMYGRQILNPLNYYFFQILMCENPHMTIYGYIE